MTNTLDAIRKREQAATPGPWYSLELPWSENAAVLSGNPDPHYGRLLADLEPFDPDQPSNPRRHDDADFIAHARTDILTLLAEVERLQAFEIKVRDALAQPSPWRGLDGVTLREILGIVADALVDLSAARGSEPQ